VKSFDITIHGREYTVDVIQDGEDVEIFIERANSIGLSSDELELEEDDIPENELLMVTEYLIREGFVVAPNLE
jgi:hypothetical protein